MRVQIVKRSFKNRDVRPTPYHSILETSWKTRQTRHTRFMVYNAIHTSGVTEKFSKGYVKKIQSTSIRL